MTCSSEINLQIFESIGRSIEKFDDMAPYFGLTGSKLHAAVWAEACVAVAIFGYNGPAGGGVLSMPSFREQFPSIDVLDAPASEQHSKSVLQGRHSTSIDTLACVNETPI